MKKSLIWGLLFFTGFSLFAQIGNDARIFIPPVAGRGSSPDDGDFFDTHLLFEVVHQRHLIADTESSADYILKGMLTPYVEGEVVAGFVDGDLVYEDEMGLLEMGWVYEPAPSEEVFDSHIDYDSVTEFLFHLELKDAKTGNVLAQQELIYEVAQDVSELLHTAVYYLLTEVHPSRETIIVVEENFTPVLLNYDWRNKWLYFSASALWSPRVYYQTYIAANVANFGFELAAEGHVLDFLSVELGFGISTDWVSTYETGADYYRDVILEIPFAVKYVFKPVGIFTIQPYTGIHFNFSLAGTTNPPVVSWMLGLQYGIKAGPGIVTIDPRFSVDIGRSTLGGRSADDPTALYQRIIMQMGVGYKYGILPRNRKTEG